MKNNPYFLYLATSDRTLPVCLVAQELLNQIAVRELLNDPITVTQAMTLYTIASPATLYRKIEDLITFGLIEHSFKGKNRKIKYLVLTNAAKKHFDKLGDAIKDSVKDAA